MSRTRRAASLAAVGAVIVLVLSSLAGPAQAGENARGHKFWTPKRMSQAKPTKLPAVRRSRARQVLRRAPSGQVQALAGRRSPRLPRRSKRLRGPRLRRSTGGKAVASWSGLELPWNNFSYGYTSATKASGRLFYTMANGLPNVCSASVVAVNVIVTAAHCVTDGGSGAQNTNFYFVPAVYGTSQPYGGFSAKPNGVTHWSEWSSSPYNCAAGTGCGGYYPMDYAFITLRPNSLGYNVGQYTSWYGILANAPKGTMYVHGYPAEGSWSQNQNYPWHCRSMPQRWSRYAYQNRYDVGLSCYNTGGSSGGPWLQTYNGRTYVASVMSHTGRVYPQDPSCFFACPRYGTTTYGPYFDNDTIRLLNYAKTK